MEWIKVEDKLPEIGVHVLVCTEYYDRKGNRLTEIFVGYMNEEEELVQFPDDWTGGDAFNEVVSHWHPLPEPPKIV